MINGKIITLMWLIVLVISGLQVFAGANETPGEHVFAVSAPWVTIKLSEGGNIRGISFKGGQILPINGGTRLAGCTVQQVKADDVQGGGVQFTKSLLCESQQRKCTLIERFLPDADSIRWEIEIIGQGQPWSVPIETYLNWPDVNGLVFWTSWGDSRPENSPGWNDPLIPVPFANRMLRYGGQTYKYSQAFSLPIATVIDTNKDVGLSLVLSPVDTPIEMTLSTTYKGNIVFSRTKNRICGGGHLRFTMNLVRHEGDFRSGLGWMVSRYPEYFNPPNPRTNAIAGNGSYSAHSGRVDVQKYMRMGYRVNWNAVFDWPYIGVYIPPVTNDNEEWVSDRDGVKTSIRKMRDYAENFRKMGFHNLSYFNVSEVGKNVKQSPPIPTRKNAKDSDLWKDANDFVYYYLRGAIVNPPSRPYPAWEGGMVLDCAESVFEQWLLNQAKRHIEKVPDSDGICIDRMDYLRWYNLNRDDGQTWLDGRPARSLVTSWQNLMSELGPMMHNADKVIYGNPLYRRLDCMRYLDGFYDEYGYMPYSLNLCSMLALSKPYIAWTSAEINEPSLDKYMQRHLYMGAYISVPFPDNNHQILPSTPEIDRYYLDYGPLFDCLKGKSWLLKPHVISVEGNTAKANIFTVPGGYVVPITFGGENAKITLQGLCRKTGQNGFLAEVIWPGSDSWTKLNCEDNGKQVVLTVGLKRGCAMIRLSDTWLKPYVRYFVKSAAIEMRTCLIDVKIRYTLSGKEPDANSQVYIRPIVIEKTTTVKMACFRGSKKVSDILTEDYVKVSPSKSEEVKSD